MRKSIIWHVIKNEYGNGSWSLDQSAGLRQVHVGPLCDPIVLKKLEISEKFFQPRTELRVLQPPTEFSERIWVNKKNISK